MNRELESVPLERLRRRQSLKWTSFPDDVLPAFVAEMDFPLAAPVKLALTDAIVRDDTGYANPAASGLGAAFAGFADRRWGWKVDPEQVTATSDVVHGLTALLRVLLSPGDGVIINPPVYHPFYSLIEEAGCRVVEAPLGETGLLDLERIEAAFRSGARAMLLCIPQNPTGTVPTRKELVALAEMAERYGTWILSDEIHAPLTLPGATHTPFLSVSNAAREQGICLTSASKTFNLAGLGCAVIVTASGNARDAVAGLPMSGGRAGHLGVIGSRVAFEEGDEWLGQVIKRLDLNRKLLGELITTELPGVSWQPPRAGYLAWLDCRKSGLGDDPSAVILSRSALATNSGPTFGTGGNGHCRLNFGTSPEILRQTVARIAAAVG